MKPKNGGLKQSSQDYMNLLYSDSDSEPDLKLPPLKGKKTRKKKSTFKSGVSGDTSVCSMWTMVKIILLIVVLATLSVLGVVSYWLMGQVNALTTQLQRVENRNQGGPEEFQKYHSQIQEINKTMHRLAAGDKGIDKIRKNLTQITSQLDELRKVTDGLKADLEKAPLLKDLPKRFDSLTNTVAKMGSDVQNAKAQLELFENFKKTSAADLEVLRQRVSSFENRTRASESAMGRETGSYTSGGADSFQWTQEIKLLSDDITSLNTSLRAQVSALNSSMMTYETRLSLLEKFTAKTKSPQISNEAIAQVLQQMLNGQDFTGLDASVPGAGINEKLNNVTSAVESLTNQFENLEAAFNDVRSYTSPGSEIETLFHLFQSETLDNLEYLNTTVNKTTGHVDHLYKVFAQNRNELNNITAKLHGLMRYLSVTLNASSKGPSALDQTAPSTTTSSTTMSSTTSPSTAKSSVREEVKTNDEHSAPIITMKLVRTETDLENKFPNWDIKGEGQVDPDDLPDFMPDPPTKEQLKPFDADNNGKYSLEEMKAALGFTEPSATEEVKHIFE